SARRAQVKAALNRFAAVHDRCRIMVTCRTHSYQQDKGWQLAWPVYELAPFSDAKISAFIAGWYGALSRRDPGREMSYQQKASTLQAALAPNDPRGLLELARTPLLLTVMAIVHAHKELPGSRVAVYRECVELLLLRWQKARAEEGGRQSLLDTLAAYGVTERQLEQGLCEVAYRAHEVGEAKRLGGGGRALVSEDTLRGVLHRWFQKSDAAVTDFLDYCQHANGLLLAQGAVATVTDAAAETVYAFPHLSFEEYLAARHLRRLRLSGSSFTRHAAELAGEPNWREVVRFLGEYLCHDKEGGDIVYAQDLLTRLCPMRQPADDADWRRNWLAGELLPALRQEAAEPERDEGLEERITGRLVALLQASSALRDTHQDRAAVGRALARVGDPRPGVGLGAEGLPDFQWVPIPGTAAVRASGCFSNFTELRLGSGARSDLNTALDKPFWGIKEDWSAQAGPLEITAFKLAIYPVTVAQFRPFVEQGYREDRWWSEAGRRDRGARTQPYFWDDPVWTLDNHPVVGVTWYDAEAYCNWLNEQLRLPRGTIRLPTEAEWEWAARGPDGRRYPWGDEWESWRCNSSESGLNRTSAVGCFPGSSENRWWKAILPDSGVVHDLAGNVWEWTASEYTEDYSGASQSVLNAHSGSPCVLRGGSWDDAPLWLRGAARD
ncbi:MAG TPA: SUMF1/EgtB/PvdO family nonheme iron enzyme, partial [Candidatus Competibacteraceae bacterium]|nr:SUMF1/EgtB/PvdO family nonheme iron enzyme [Candidatus Competibacteraceae bacterium]